MGDSKIEVFFLKNLLQIALIGVSIILVTDIALTFHDVNSVTIDFIVLAAVLTSFILLKVKKYTAATLVITIVPLIAEFYQAVQSPDSTVPLTVILTIGFSFSILLKGRLLWFMQIITMIGLIVIFCIQAQHPEFHVKEDVNDLMAVAVTYMVLYILVVLSAGTLKARYDTINHELKVANHELIEKTNEIEAQNDELIQSQDKLNSINQFLEQSVEDRTQQILRQNEQLLKYAHTNAHHVRGPIARVLGLIQLSKIDPTLNLHFVFEKIEHETNEIDAIITRITVELEKTSE